MVGPQLPLGLSKEYVLPISHCRSDPLLSILPCATEGFTDGISGLPSPLLLVGFS